MEKKFWDLPYEDRKKIVWNRQRNARYFVWDYVENSQGVYAPIYSGYQFVDRGFVHGFVTKGTDAPLSPFHDDLSVYCNDFPLDEEFETRSLNLWHAFSTKEKAEEYAAKARANRKQIDYETLLVEVKKHCKDARLAKGHRGYENGADDYQAIVLDKWGESTLRVLPDSAILFQCGGGNKVIIPHIDLIGKIMNIFAEKSGDSMYNSMLCYGFYPSVYYGK